MVTSYYIMKMSRNKGTVDIDDYYSNLHKLPMKTKGDLNNNKCRVCLKPGNISIYGNENTPDISEALSMFGDIEISEDDHYPKHLCQVCYKFIKGAILFRKIAKRSDEVLRRPVKEETKLDHLQDMHNDYNDANIYKPRKSSRKWLMDEPVTSVTVNNKGKLVRKVACPICSKIFSKSYYKAHLALHDPNHQKYVCDICGKSFRLRSAHYSHKLMHRNDFPHKCQLCPYRGRYAQLLKTHMRKHAGDYRYMCTECPTKFIFKSNLNRHMRKHKEPQFKCDACERAFHTKLILQRHFETAHMGIKNHVCNLCGKAFGHRKGMVKHQHNFHKTEKSSIGRMPSYLEAELKNKVGGT